MILIVDGIEVYFLNPESHSSRLPPKIIKLLQNIEESKKTKMTLMNIDHSIFRYRHESEYYCLIVI